MLVTTNVRVTLIEDSGAPVNAGFRDGALCSRQSCYLGYNRKVKGIISCFMLLELKSSSLTLAAILISLSQSSSMAQLCISTDINSDLFTLVWFLHIFC